MRKFAISDIHGHVRTFRHLVQNQLKPKPRDEIYLLGDYVDRGPDSKGVIDFIWELQGQGLKVHCLLGNHERMMLDSNLNEDSFSFWYVNGGKETLESFGAKKLDDIPAAYLDFLHELELVLEVDEYILVHAGLNFKEPDPIIPHDNMIWLRAWYEKINYEWLGSRKIIHGHTPTDDQSIEKMFRDINKNQYLCIDAGCYLTQSVGMGNLCAFDFANGQLYFQENIDYEIN